MQSMYVKGKNFLVTGCYLRFAVRRDLKVFNATRLYILLVAFSNPPPPPGRRSFQGCLRRILMHVYLHVSVHTCPSGYTCVGERVCACVCMYPIVVSCVCMMCLREEYHDHVLCSNSKADGEIEERTRGSFHNNCLRLATDSGEACKGP